MWPTGDVTHRGREMLSQVLKSPSSFYPDWQIIYFKDIKKLHFKWTLKEWG